MGLIESDWGGTPAQSWTSLPALKADPALKFILDDWDRVLANYPAAKQRYEPFDKLVDEDPQSRGVLARMAARAFKGGRRVWITANNKAEGSAPLSLVKLAEEIDKNLH